MLTSSYQSNLNRFLKPSSIAVVGGGIWGNLVISQCKKFGFLGDLWPIHQNKKNIQSYKCYKDISELPYIPDATFIAVNNKKTIEIVSTLNKLKAGGAVCFASGFKETGEKGDKLEKELLEAAEDMPILGPNCLGYINYLDGAFTWAGAQGGKKVNSGVAILSQSGNIAINLTMQKRALPIAYMISLGNQAQLGVSKLILSMLMDERVTAIGIYLEGIDDLEDFILASEKAREKKIPIVILNSGSSAIGTQITTSHTASMTGSDDALKAMFKRLGVASVKSPTELIETLKFLHFNGVPKSNSIVTLSCSGGEASIMSDLGENLELNFRPFNKKQKETIKKTVNPIVSITNPFDYHTFDWENHCKLEKTYSKVLDCNYDLTALVIDIPRKDRCEINEFLGPLEAFKRASKKSKTSCAVVSSLPENFPEDIAESIAEKGLVPLFGLYESLITFETVVKMGLSLEQKPFYPWKVSKFIEKVITLTEYQSKNYLSESGVKLPDRDICESFDQCNTIAKKIGYPVVLKSVGENISHKTEINAVRLGINNSQELKKHFNELKKISETILIEKMLQNKLAEIVIGIKLDPIMGFYMMIGAGGIYTEIFKDTKVISMPAEKKSIAEALNSLNYSEILYGYRGSQKVDIQSLVGCILKLQKFVYKKRDEILELEINPILVFKNGNGVCIADALIKLRESKNVSKSA